MINQILSTAVKLYLRSQVTEAEDLQVKIIGKNSQILKGYIPQVFLGCDYAVYQGLCLHQVEVKGTNIGFNLPEVLKKKPLKLLEPIVVDIQLGLDAEDLQGSLNSPLLKSALGDLWQIVLAAQPIDGSSQELANISLTWHDISISSGRIDLTGSYHNERNQIVDLNLSTGIELTNSHTLCLSSLKITRESNIVSNLVEQLEIDLGTDVFIEKLVIESEQIICSGKITINA